MNVFSAMGPKGLMQKQPQPNFAGRVNARKKAEEKGLKLSTAVSLGAGGLSLGTTVSGGGPAAFALAVREIMPLARVLVPMTTIGGGGYFAYSALKPDSMKQGDLQGEAFDPNKARLQLKETLKELREDAAQIEAGNQKVSAMVQEEVDRLQALQTQGTKLNKRIQDFTQQGSQGDNQGEVATALRQEFDLLSERIKSQETFLATCQAHQNQRLTKGKEIQKAITQKIQKFEDLISQLDRLEKLDAMSETLQEQSEAHLGSQSTTSKEMMELRSRIEAEFQEHLSTAQDAKLATEVQQALQLEEERQARESLQQQTQQNEPAAALNNETGSRQA